MQKLIISIFFASFYQISYASNTLPVDSIGVENNNNKKTIIHKIESKETYYSLGRKYAVSPKDIIAFNHNKVLTPGLIIKVPTQRPFVVAQVSTANRSEPIRHVVKAKENLGMIAEKYNITLADLRTANGITGSNLAIGQILIIPGSTMAVQPYTAQAPPTIQTQLAEHTVQPKEFLLKIAEKYGTTVEELKRINHLTSNNLSIGQILKIPAGNTDAPLPSETSARAAEPKKGPSHTVLAGETIFSIAQKYEITAYQIRQLNNLSDNTIRIGQHLTLPADAELRSVPEAAAAEQVDDGDETLKDPNLRRNANVYGLNQMEEKGIAMWIADPDLDANKMLVLHRNLAIGSIIKITNPMTNISAFAKVVGKFTENESTKDVIIVATKAVADRLGVLDKRFLCNITYATVENDQ